MLCIRGTSHGPVSVSVCVCLSVCLSQAGVLLKRQKRRITQTTPHDTQGSLVFCCQRSPRNSTGVTPTRAPNAGRVVRIGDFRQITGYISKTVKDRHIPTFNGPFSGTTRVSWYQKGKTNPDSTGARDSERQWHQPGHTQARTSLQTDNHASTPPLWYINTLSVTLRSPISFSTGLQMN